MSATKGRNSYPGYTPGTKGPKTGRYLAGTPYEAFGVPAQEASKHPAHAPASFFSKYKVQSESISIAKDVVVDREWTCSRAAVVCIKGLLSLEAVQAMLDEENNSGNGKEILKPVVGLVGKDAKQYGMGTIWINRIDDSSWGKYQEIIFSVDVYSTKATETTPRRTVRLGNLQKDVPYAIWYNQFSSDVCEGQYLDSLYIDSPVSIFAGRELQAFPKHPESCVLETDLDAKVKTIDVTWKDTKEPIIKITTTQKFGFGGFVRQGWKLVRHVGFGKVNRFLLRPSFGTNLFMPQKVAQQHNRPRHYVGTMYKSTHPTAVKVWPWNPATDRLEWNDAPPSRPTGCEPHNAAILFAQGKFEPVTVSYLAQASGVVALRYPES